jgi:hypothetical protein
MVSSSRTVCRLLVNNKKLHNHFNTWELKSCRLYGARSYGTGLGNYLKKIILRKIDFIIFITNKLITERSMKRELPHAAIPYRNYSSGGGEREKKETIQI